MRERTQTWPICLLCLDAQTNIKTSVMSDAKKKMSIKMKSIMKLHKRFNEFFVFVGDAQS